MIKAQKFACFVSIVLLLTILLSIVLFVMPITSAEETTDKYVVFNQQCPNGNFVNTDNWSANASTISVVDNTLVQSLINDNTSHAGFYYYIANSNFNFVSGHKYYFSFSVKSPVSTFFTVESNNDIIFRSNVTSNEFTRLTSIITPSKNGGFLAYVNGNVLSKGDIIYYKNCYCIDLTIMYGAGNEPTIDTCRNLFLADYYPYNTDGSVISLDGLSSYNRGVLDTYKSYVVNFEGTIFNNALSPMYNFGHSDSVLSAMGVDTLLFGGDLFLSFGGNVFGGTTINITFDSLLIFENTIFSISLIFNNHLYPLASFTTSQENFNYNFVLPFDATGLVLTSVSSSNSSTISTTSFSGAKLTFTSFSNVLLDDLKYNYGYENGYKDGTTAGYNNGYNKGLSIGSDKRYSFTGLLDAVVQAPITALIGSYDSSGNRVGGLLNFDFLGVNLSYFFTGLISVTIVMVVIRFILSRK